MLNEKSVYICGPLTELTPEMQEAAKRFYKRIADLCEELTGTRAFVPHEHYDPVKHAHWLPRDVDAAERVQVYEKTSLLVVVATAPSWGGGIEVEMANKSDVPIILLCERKKLEDRKISRLLRGNPAVVNIISYNDEEEALVKLRRGIQLAFSRTPPRSPAQ